MNDILLSKANTLEGILRTFLDCGYNEFGVKANNKLLKDDWKSPINFALGVLYERNPELKSEIQNFLGNIFYVGYSIEDAYNQIDDKNEALEYIETVITKLEKLLNKDSDSY